MQCRFCCSRLKTKFLDLGFAPPSNAYLDKTDLNRPEITYPLRVWVCDKCWLVQTEDYNSAESLFSEDYAYFSSASTTWLKHAKEFCESICSLEDLGPSSLVIEVASNDGYLLQFFQEKGIPCVGIEPTLSTASAAIKKGLKIYGKFFGENFAKEMLKKGETGNLVVANNVLAHVPDINDFLSGIKLVLKRDGVFTCEFPHLANLIKFKQFDTIYHEHYSYLSLETVRKIFAHHKMDVFRADEIPTHGGSLRVFACHAGERDIQNNVQELIEKENVDGLFSIGTYKEFQNSVDEIKFNFIRQLLKWRDQGKNVFGYGAAAKGNTLLNFCGVKNDLIQLVCDVSLSKQGKFLPGSHLQVLSPDALVNADPDVVIIFPWNIANEIKSQLSLKLKGDVQYIVAIPRLKSI